MDKFFASLTLTRFALAYQSNNIVCAAGWCLLPIRSVASLSVTAYWTQCNFHFCRFLSVSWIMNFVTLSFAYLVAPRPQLQPNKKKMIIIYVWCEWVILIRFGRLLHQHEIKCLQRGDNCQIEQRSRDTSEWNEAHQKKKKSAQAMQSSEQRQQQQFVVKIL